MGDRKKPLAILAALIAFAVIVGVSVGRDKPKKPIHVEIELATMAAPIIVDAGVAIADAGETEEIDGGIALAALPPPDMRVRLPRTKRNVVAVAAPPPPPPPAPPPPPPTPVVHDA